MICTTLSLCYKAHLIQTFVGFPALSTFAARQTTTIFTMTLVHFLSQLTKEVFTEVNGKTPELKAIHAGALCLVLLVFDVCPLTAASTHRCS